MNKLFMLVFIGFFVLSSSYAIDVTDCINITASGSYIMTTNITGAIDEGDINERCVQILADDVFFDCDDYWIEDNETIGAFAGIWVQDVDNVSIIDCNIRDFSYNIRGDGWNNSYVDNINSFARSGNGTSVGIGFWDGVYVNISNVYAEHNGTGGGIHSTNSEYIIIEDCDLNNLGGTGITIGANVDTTIRNVTMDGASSYGLQNTGQFTNMTDTSINCISGTYGIAQIGGNRTGTTYKNVNISNCTYGITSLFGLGNTVFEDIVITNISNTGIWALITNGQSYNNINITNCVNYGLNIGSTLNVPFKNINIRNVSTGYYILYNTGNSNVSFINNSFDNWWRSDIEMSASTTIGQANISLVAEEPTNWTNVSQFLKINTASDWVYMKTYWEDDDIVSNMANTSTMKFWKNDSNGWWNDTFVGSDFVLNESENYMELNITNSSTTDIVAILGYLDFDEDGTDWTIDCDDNDSSVLPLINNSMLEIFEDSTICTGDYIDAQIDVEVVDVTVDCNFSNIVFPTVSYFSSFGSHGTEIRNCNLSDTNSGQVFNMKDNVDNLTIYNNSFYNVYGTLYGIYFGWISSGHNVSNNYFENSSYALYFNSITDSVFENNIVNGTNNNYAIYLSSGQAITGNRMIGNVFTGIAENYYAYYILYQDNVLSENETILDDSNSFYVMSPVGVPALTMENLTVNNFTVINTSFDMIAEGGFKMNTKLISDLNTIPSGITNLQDVFFEFDVSGSVDTVVFLNQSYDLDSASFKIDSFVQGVDNWVDGYEEVGSSLTPPDPLDVSWGVRGATAELEFADGVFTTSPTGGPPLETYAWQIFNIDIDGLSENSTLIYKGYATGTAQKLMMWNETSSSYFDIQTLNGTNTEYEIDITTDMLADGEDSNGYIYFVAESMKVGSLVLYSDYFELSYEYFPYEDSSIQFIKDDGSWYYGTDVGDPNTVNTDDYYGYVNFTNMTGIYVLVVDTGAPDISNVEYDECLYPGVTGYINFTINELFSNDTYVNITDANGLVFECDFNATTGAVSCAYNNSITIGNVSYVIYSVDDYGQNSTSTGTFEVNMECNDVLNLALIWLFIFAVLIVGDIVVKEDIASFVIGILMALNGLMGYYVYNNEVTMFIAFITIIFLFVKILEYISKIVR